MSSESLSIPASLVPLLISNDAPHPSQSAVVEEVLRAKQTELSKLEDEIKRLESALKVLQTNHYNLKTELDGYKSILSPIRRVPPEVLGEVFLYFVPSADKTHPHYDSLTRISLPWKLGQICRRWRAVALSLSELWALLDLGPFHCYDVHSSSRPVDMDLDDDDYALEYDDARGFGDLALGRTRIPCASDLADARNADAEGFRLQAALESLEGSFQRCGSRPFSLRLWDHEFTDKTLLHYIATRTALCQELVLPNPVPELVDCIFDLDVSLPSLRSLVLSAQNLYVYTRPIFVHAAAANLTHLTLISLTIEPPAADSIPWSHLTGYCEVLCRWINFVDGDQGRLAAYRKLTNLIDLRMDLFDHIFFQAAAVPVALPNVRSVSLRLRGLYRTIQAFDMPMLEEFSIEYSHAMHAFYQYGAIQPMICLFPYCSHPCSHLRVFRAMAGPFDPPFDPAFDIGSALEQFPDLVELSLDIPNLISNTLVSRLVPHDGKLPLAPKLERIHFPNRSLLHKDCLWQTLVDMLYARFRPTVHGVSRLHTFEFPTDKRSHDVDVVAGLKTLRKRHHWDIKVGSESVFPAWNEWRT